MRNKVKFFFSWVIYRKHPCPCRQQQLIRSPSTFSTVIITSLAPSSPPHLFLHGAEASLVFHSPLHSLPTAQVAPGSRRPR